MRCRKQHSWQCSKSTSEQPSWGAWVPGSRTCATSVAWQLLRIPADRFSTEDAGAAAAACHSLRCRSRCAGAAHLNGCKLDLAVCAERAVRFMGCACGAFFCLWYSQLQQVQTTGPCWCRAVIYESWADGHLVVRFTCMGATRFSTLWSCKVACCQQAGVGARSAGKPFAWVRLKLADGWCCVGFCVFFCRTVLAAGCFLRAGPANSSLPIGCSVGRMLLCCWVAQTEAALSRQKQRWQLVLCWTQHRGVAAAYFE